MRVELSTNAFIKNIYQKNNILKSIDTNSQGNISQPLISKNRLLIGQYAKVPLRNKSIRTTVTMFS